MDVRFETGALESYRDFINALRNARPNSKDAIKVITEARDGMEKSAGLPGADV